MDVGIVGVGGIEQVPSADIHLKKGDILGEFQGDVVDGTEPCAKQRGMEKRVKPARPVLKGPPQNVALLCRIGVLRDNLHEVLRMEVDRIGEIEDRCLGGADGSYNAGDGPPSSPINQPDRYDRKHDTEFGPARIRNVK